MRLTALLLCCLASQVSAAPPTVSYFFPQGAQKGQTVQVKVSGSFSQWPVGVWVDRPGLTWKPEKAKGSFKVTAAANARGVFLVRFHGSEGASPVRPFVVDALPEQMEKEDNAVRKSAQHLAAGAIVNGKLGKGGDVDIFSLEAKAGQTVVAAVRAFRVFGSPMDSVVQICDSNGFVLEQNDDGGGYDPLATHKVQKDGRYYVRVFAFPTKPNSSIAFSGADGYVYRLTATSGPFVDYVLPMAVKSTSPPTAPRLSGWNLGSGNAQASFQGASGRSFAFSDKSAGWCSLPASSFPTHVAPAECSHKNPLKITLPAVVSGCIEKPRDADAFTFPAKKGQNVHFVVDARKLGFPLDAVIQVRDSKDKLLKESDDAARGKRDTELTFRIPADGNYSVEIRDVNGHGGRRHAYRLTAQVVQARASLSVAADHFELQAGKSLEIPVSVARTGGFADEISIRCLDLPPGVEAKAVVSKGKKSATVKLKLTAKMPAKAAIRIVGQVKGKDKLVARCAVPNTELKLERLWLTATKKK